MKKRMKNYIIKIIKNRDNRSNVVLSLFGLIGIFLFLKGLITGIWINPWNLIPTFLMNLGPITVSLGIVLVGAIFITPFFTIISVIVFLRNYFNIKNH